MFNVAIILVKGMTWWTAGAFCPTKLHLQLATFGPYSSLPIKGLELPF